MKRALSLLLVICMTFGVMMALLPIHNIASAQDTDTELPKTLVNPTNSEGRNLNFNQGWKFTAKYIAEATATDYSLVELQKWENVNLPHSVRLEKYANGGQGGIYMGDAMYVKHFSISEDDAGKKIFINFEGVMGTSNVWVNGVKMTTKLAEKTGDATYYGGYLPFVIDISDVAICDGTTENVIVVYANSKYDPTVPPGKDPNALDFSYFGGIYRDVTMTITDGVHITNSCYEDIVAGGGILVDYPSVSTEVASVYIKTHVRNEHTTAQSVYLVSRIVDADGVTVAEGTTDARSFDASSDYSFEQTLTVTNPKLWNLDSPYLHTLVSTVYADGNEVDTVSTVIGIRKIEMHRDYGLKINGVVQNMLNGVNRHQEYAYIGYAASASLQRKDAMKFKEAGINVVRTAHYPASVDFLDACDELGILVIEPTPGWQWYSSDPLFEARVKNDIRQMVRRDRNRPCMLAYETVLNETSVPAGFTLGLAEVAKEEHPSAKVATENSVAEGEKDTVSDIMYKNPERSDFAVAFTREYGDSYREQTGPDNFFFRRVFRGTGMDYGYYPGGEGAMFLQAIKRLVGNQPDTPYYCPVDAASGSVGGSSGPNRSYLFTVNSYLSGQADGAISYIGATSWIGIDHNRTYAGDMSACGLWDLLRLPKFSYYAMASQRKVESDAYLTSLGIDNGPLVFISSYWTETAPKFDKTNEAFDTLGTDSERIIIVFSNTAKVKLSVVAENGEVLWTQTASPMTGNNREYMNAPFQFLSVPYTKGSHLEAIGYDVLGNELASHEVYTASTPTRVTLSADTMGISPVADGSDTVMIYGYIKDANGNICHDAYNTMTFSIVSGDATIVGDGNARVGANPVNAEAGIFGVYVKMGTTPGDIVIRVDSEGLEGSEITITSVEMTEPASSYYLIAYTGTGEEETTEKLANVAVAASNNVSGMLSKLVTDSVEIDGETYDNSIIFYNNFDVHYNTAGLYNRFRGSLTVLDNGNPAAAGIFKVYADNRLIYVTDVVLPGEVINFDLDIDNCNTLRLRVVGLDHDTQNYPHYVWLDPTLVLGENEVDESGLYENIALGKPTEASSVIDGSSSRFAVDGNVLNTWVGNLVGEGSSAQPQYLIVDLTDTNNLVGAKIGLLNDSITYKYEIHTSPDKETWTKVATVAKTGQASNEIDFFSAEGVRYVKIVFNEVGTDEERGQYSNATITELEIYEDRGVSSVRDYMLKNLGIDGKDIVFDPYKQEYSVDLEGYETELRVFASAFKSDAVIKVDGVVMSEDCAAISQLSADNIIKVLVTYGKASTEYRIKVNGNLGDIYYDNAMNTMDDHKNGESRWLYQRYDSTSGKFIDIGTRWVYGDHQPYLAAENSSVTWTRMGALYAHPGSGSNKVSRTYVAPISGKATISLWASKLYNINGTLQSGTVGLSIYHNGEKVWPLDSDHVQLTGGSVVTYSLVLTLNAGDTINFVVDNWDGSNGMDATYMDTTVSYKSTSALGYEEFLNTHSGILSKTPLTVTIDDKEAVESGLADMKACSLTVRKMLVEERRLLESLLDAINTSNADTIVAGVERFAGTHSLGGSFTLPSVAKVYMANGTIVESAVTWNAYDVSILDTVGEYEIGGTVAEYGLDTYYRLTVTTISQNATSTGLPMAFASYSNIKSGGAGGDFVHLANDGVYTGNWTTYNSKNTQEWLGMIFGNGTTPEAKNIDKILLTMPTISTYATQVPNLIKVQYYIGPDISELPSDPNNMLGTTHPLALDENWADATIISQEEFASQKTSAICIESVNSIAIRLVMTPNKRPSGIAGCIGIVEMLCHEAPPQSSNVSNNSTSTGVPMAFASYSNITSGGTGGDFVHLVNDGVYQGNWTTYNSKNTQEWLGILFDGNRSIDRITLSMPLISTYATQVPNLIKVQYYIGPDFSELPADPNNMLGTTHPLAMDENWADATIISQEEFASLKTSSIIIERVRTIAIRLVMTPNNRPSGIAGCIGIVEMVCYESPTLGDSTSEISDILLDGKPLAGFEVEKTDYSYDAINGIPEVEVILGDHSALTVIKPLDADGVITIIVTAENGESVRVYNITLGNSQSFDVTLGKEFLIGDIDTLFAEYAQADYGENEWKALLDIFANARSEVDTYTTLAEIENFDLEALKSSADAVKTKAQENGSGVKVNLTLSAEINVNLYAPKDGSILGISINGLALSADERTFTINGVEYYVYHYNGIAPNKAMEGFTVEIRCLENGKIVTKELRYSVIKYADSILSRTDIDQEGKTLTADVVGFIKAAYEYFGNEDATTEEIEYLYEVATRYPATVVDSIPTLDGIDPSGISSVVYSAQYSLADGVIRLKLNIADSTQPLSVTVDGKTVASLEAYHGQSSIYIGMRAYQLCDTMTLRSGELVGTYSFSTYAKEIMGTDAKLDALLLAMYAYSLSALNYRS